MASLRIYNRALTAGEIDADRGDDLNTLAVTADLIKQYSAGKAVFVSGKMGGGGRLDGAVEVRHASLRQGIGLGYDTIYATGYRARQGLTIKTKGGGNLNLNPDSGYVGIGTADPQATLQIGVPESVGAPSLRIGWGANNEVDKLTIYGSDDYKMGLRRGSRDLKIFAKSKDADAHIYLMPNDTIAMSLLSNGNVGIGTPKPKAPLDVGDTTLNVMKTVLARLDEGNGDGVGTCLGVRAYNTQSDNTMGGDRSFALEHYFYGNLNSAINFNRGGGPNNGYMTFTAGGNIPQMTITQDGVAVRNGSVGNISSRDLKENISGLTAAEAMNTLQNLNPVKYDYKDDKASRQKLGFIAEEMPDNLASEDRKTVWPFEVIPVLTKVAKEQQRTIAALQEQIHALQEEVRRQHAIAPGEPDFNS
jgi:hypothetical protein